MDDYTMLFVMLLPSFFIVMVAGQSIELLQVANLFSKYLAGTVLTLKKKSAF